MLLYGIGPIFAGIIAGFPLGGFKKLQTTDRVLIAILLGGCIGLTSSFLASQFVPPTNISVILAVLVSLGGTLMGMALNWNPSIPKGTKHHIIYEPDDEDSFDREIDDALKGRYNQRDE